MMSVPAINPVLPSSGNQPPKVGSGPATSSVTPLGLTVQQKMSVIPQSIPSSPNKPPISVNHTPGPLSLVHENKISGVQAPGSLAKSSDKPKDLSPVKPTSNGVETATGASATKASSPTQASQGNSTVVKPAEEKPTEAPVENHADTPKTDTFLTPVSTTVPMAPCIETKLEETKNVQPQNSSVKVEETANQTKSGESLQSKLNDEAPPPQSPPHSESPTDNKSGKIDVKSTTGPNKRKREVKLEDKKTDDPVPEKKPQRIRSQVLPYQSPLPELATFINKSLKEKDAAQKSSDEKLIVFYKNEFLAVRNAENGFYLCQTLQNVYRTSHRIRIRWLSQDKESNTVYTPDFYDFTDIECILTTVGLEKLDKNKYKLPQIELERTENILKRALDVEKGVSEKPPVTEEHPDGIDLSLYKDESQLQKPKKRKSTSPAKRSPKQPKKSDKEESQGEEERGEVREEPKKKSKSRAKRDKKSAKPSRAKAKTGKKGKPDLSAVREKPTKNVDQLKVSPPNEKARVVAKVLRKVEVTQSSSKKSKSKGKIIKSNSKKSEKKNLKTEKSTLSSRNSERRVSTATSRKKSSKK